VVRTTLDLPTTDPGSDLHFSTDDEEHSPTSGHNGYGAVPPLRHTLLQSDLQRRYIEEIGDTVVQKPKASHMPPELIVTTPSKSGTPGGGKKLDVYKLTPRTAPELDTGIGMMQRQAGGTGTSARRTYSWHNLDQQEIPNGNGGGQGKANFYIGDTKPGIKTMAKPLPRRWVFLRMILRNLIRLVYLFQGVSRATSFPRDMEMCKRPMTCSLSFR